MSSSPPSYSEHERYADSAGDYLDQHNIYALLSGLLQKLVVQRPADPLAFLASSLEQPVASIKIVVVAPPECQSKAVVTDIVREMGLLRMRLASLVAEESAAGNALAKQALTYLDAGSAGDIPEHIAVPLLAARALKADAQNGWVLEDYPTTRAQALAMQAGGILPTHCLYFTRPPLSSGAAAPVVLASGIDVDPATALLAAAYTRHSAAVAEVFAPVCRFLDLGKSEQALVDEVRALCDAAPRSRAPRRPMRVLLLGPRGSGRHTQAARLSEKFGLVHVNVSELIRSEVKKIPALQQKVAQYASTGLLVPDEICVPLVLERIMAADARQRGFVLDGFPRTPAQAQALAKSQVQPSRVIVLAISEEEANARVSGRRVDAQTGDVYFTHPHPLAVREDSLPMATRERLTHVPNDQPHTLEAIQFTFASYIDEIKATYRAVLREIPAGGRAAKDAKDVIRNKESVSEAIDDFVLAPLNNRYAHAKKKAAAAEQAK